MKVLVTGAGGYIGSAVVRAMVEAGHSVVGMIRNDAAAEQVERSGAVAVRGDVTDPLSFLSALEGCNGVVHTAVGRNGQVTDSDHLAVAAMLSSLENRESTFVLTSGLGVYAGTQADLVDENTPLNGALPPQMSRVALERLVLDAPSPVRPVVIRPAHVYGRGRSGKFTQVLLDASRNAEAGLYIGDGAGWYGTVHVDDLGRAFEAAISGGAAAGPFNLVGQHLPLREVAIAMGYAVGAEGRTRSVDGDEADAIFGPLQVGLRGARPVSTVRATRLLSWTPTAASLTFELIHGTLS